MMGIPVKDRIFLDDDSFGRLFIGRDNFIRILSDAGYKEKEINRILQLTDWNVADPDKRLLTLLDNLSNFRLD